MGPVLQLRGLTVSNLDFDKSDILLLIKSKSDLSDFSMNLSSFDYTIIWLKDETLKKKILSVVANKKGF